MDEITRLEGGAVPAEVTVAVGMIILLGTV